MMTKKKKRLDVSFLESIARDATRKAFEKALAEGCSWITPEQEENLTLGTRIGDDTCIFLLYISNDNPKYTLFISRVVVDRYTAEVIGKVQVYLPPVLNSALPEWYVGR